jgi:hypothetical protein
LTGIYQRFLGGNVAVMGVQGTLGTMRSGRRTAHGIAGWQRLLLALLLLCLPLAQAADEPYRIELLLSEAKGPYQSLAQALRSELRDLPDAPAYRIHQSLAANPDRTQIGLADLTVTVGSAASQGIDTLAPTGQVLQLLIPSTSYMDGPGAATETYRSAIFIDQPWARQLSLIQLTLPGVEHIGLLLGDTSQHLLPQLEQAIQARRWHAQIGLVTEASGYFGPLRRVLEQSEVLLAVPDQAVFNRQNLQGILLTSYRREVPMIGFSPGYVRAGALAAVYSTPEQIAHQAAQWIAALLADRSRRLPAPTHPAEYSVAVNHQVARSLGLRLPMEEALLHELQRLEGAP